MRLKLLAAYGSGLLVLAVVWAGLMAIERAEEAQLLVEQAEAIRHQCDRLEVTVFEARLSQVALVPVPARGKMPRPGPDEASLTAARAARDRVLTEYAILATMVVDTPSQRALVDALAPRLDALVLALREGVAIAERAMSAPSDESSLEALAVFLALFDDQSLRAELEAVRSGIAELARNEAARVAERREVLTERQARARLILVIGGALAFLLITWVITRIRHSIVEMARARRTIAAQNDALGQQMRELESVIADLDQFAYVASHDLKAPLRGIASLAEWLEEDCAANLPKEGLEHLRLMRLRVKRMEALVDGVLAYARAGREQAVVEEVEVEGLVREVVDLVSPGTGARIEVEGPWPTLRVTRVALQQVLLNLVSNAVKHGRPAGGDGALVRVSAQREVDGSWRFEVADQGPGIDPRFHERVFGLFQTLPSSGADGAAGGTGIGLAVVKKLVERQGGVVSMRSTPGAGTTFGFTWPAPEVGPATQAKTRPRARWRRRPKTL